MIDQDVLKWQKMINELYMEENPGDKIHSAIADIAGELGITMIQLSVQKDRDADTERTLYLDQTHSKSDCVETFQYSYGKGEDVYQFRIYAPSEEIFNRKTLQFLEFLTQMVFVVMSSADARKHRKESDMRDWKTGIGNLNYLFHKGQALVEQGRIEEFAAVYFNIKNFRLLNEVFDSQTCDRLLVNYAQSLQSLLQEEEILIRLGGDGFVALVYKENLIKFLHYIKDFPVYLNHNMEKIEQHLSARAGVYIPDNPHVSIGQIMNYISVSMANAKAGEGEDGIVYYSEVLTTQLNLQNQLKSALEHDIENSGLIAYFQPKVNLENNKIVGAEALVRWQYGDRILSPDEFIPMAERNGLVCEIDYEILRQTCEHIAKWQEEQLEVVPVSVNFSKRHLMNTQTAKMIFDTVMQYKVNPSLIEIEFTETAFHKDQKIFRETVDELKHYGFRTSVDDFGAGSSNLNLLQNLMFDVLKIDKSFLDDNENQHRNQIILGNLVNMAEGLSMSVICEGVETKEHAEFLKSIHCNCVQGFLFDKPLTPEEFRKKLIMKSYNNDLE